MKIGWGLINKPDALWVKVLCKKYCCGEETIPVEKKNAKSSAILRAIHNTWNYTLKGVAWILGNGKTRFWDHSWLGSGKILSQVAFSEVSEDQLDLKVADFVKSNGSWDVEKFKNLLPQQIVHEIAGTTSPKKVLPEDIPSWKFTPQGSFSTKTTFESLTDFPVIETRYHWKYLWKWDGPEHIKTFILDDHSRWP